MEFKQLYDIIVNEQQALIQNNYVQYFDLSFFVILQSNGQIVVSKQFIKNSDQFKIKCQKINVDIWNLIQQQDKQHRNKLLFMFSLIDSNFIDFKFNFGFLSYQSLQILLNLNSIIVNFILNEIQDKYVVYDRQYRNKLAQEFNRFYRSDKGMVLKNKEIIDYLTYSRFWEKLGLNYFDVKKLPYDIYNQFNLVIGIENQTKINQLSRLNKG